MKDIAAELGVSTALVSYVLNGKMTDRINIETAERIRALAKKYRYSPNQIAQSLKSRKTHTIGLIVADISNLFYSAIARHIEDEANNFGYHVLFGSAYEDPERFGAILEVFVAKQVDGLILAVPEGGDKYLSGLQHGHIPFVVLDREFDGVKRSKIVNIDNYSASREVVEHLCRNGFRRVGAITLKTKLRHLEERKRGFVEGWHDVRERNQPFVYEITEKELDNEIEQTLVNAIHVDHVDAVYFFTNKIAMAGLAVLARLTIDVPNQLGVVCFDEADAYRIFRKELSYIRQPLKEMSQRAVRIVLEKEEVSPENRFKAVLIPKESSQRRHPPQHHPK